MAHQRSERDPEWPRLLPRNVRSGHERILAMNTVNLAIGRFRARRAEGLVNGDPELVREMEERVRLATLSLEELEEAEAGRAREIHERYTELIRATPDVPAEILDQHDREFGSRDEDLGPEIFPMGPPPEDFM